MRDHTQIQTLGDCTDVCKMCGLDWVKPALHSFCRWWMRLVRDENLMWSYRAHWKPSSCWVCHSAMWMGYISKHTLVSLNFPFQIALPRTLAKLNSVAKGRYWPYSPLPKKERRVAAHVTAECVRWMWWYIFGKFWLKEISPRTAPN